jgi:serine phosphatase RsbU (regulator of sigma subunit)
MTTRSTGNTAVIRKAFAGLDQEALDKFRTFAVKKTYPPDTVLCAEGETADIFYIVNSGRVVISREVEGADDDFVMGFVGPGGYFGEMALITEEARSATVTTLVETEVLEIKKDQFEEIFSASPALARSLLGTLVEIIRETDQRAIEDLEARYGELAEAYEQLAAAQADRIAKAALEAQLEVAAKAQRSLMPTELPNLPGYQLAARFEPARQIGGDMYDARLLESGQVAVLLADVSDKGAHAALFMAVARTLFLTEGRDNDDLVGVMRNVHRGLIDASRYDMFVTAIYGVLDPRSGLFRYVRAGHDEPLWVGSDGSHKFLHGGGRFLGLWADPAPQFDEQCIRVQSGDCLVIYSDGVTDMRNPDGDSYGRERLAKLVTTLRAYDAERIADSIYHVSQQHRGPIGAFDDFTLLVIRAE